MELTNATISSISAAISAACAFFALLFSFFTVSRAAKSDRARYRPRIVVDLVQTGRDLLAFRVINKGVDPALNLSFIECNPIPKSVARDEGDDEAWFVKETVAYLPSGQSLICIIGCTIMLGKNDDGSMKFSGKLKYADSSRTIYKESFSVDSKHYSPSEIEVV